MAWEDCRHLQNVEPPAPRTPLEEAAWMSRSKRGCEVPLYPYRCDGCPNKDTVTAEARTAWGPDKL
jgi:hypothetical protein